MAAACSSPSSLSPLSGSLAVLDDRKGSQRLSGAGRLVGWLCPGAGADDRQAGRCWRSVSPVVLAVSASLRLSLLSPSGRRAVLAVSLCLYYGRRQAGRCRDDLWGCAWGAGGAGAGRGRFSGQSQQKIKRNGICQNAQKRGLKTEIFLYVRLVSNEENH